MTGLAQNAGDAASLLDLAGWLADASPAVIFVVVLVALSRGWLVLPRELAARDARIAELTKEKDEYKQMAFKVVGLGERIAAATERTDR